MAVKVRSEFFGENNLLGFWEAKTIPSGVAIAGFYRCVAVDTGPIKTIIRSASPQILGTLLAVRNIRTRSCCAALVRFR